MLDPFFILSFLGITALGLAFGSFATVLVHRIPLGQSWITENKKAARSRCTSCNAQLGIADLVPLFSYLFSKGCCRHCGQKIPSIYWQVELTTLLFCWAAFFFAGLPFKIVLLCFMAPFLVALLFIDLKHYILPDVLLLCLVGLFVCFELFQLNSLFQAGYANFLNVATMLGGPVLQSACYGGLAWGLRYVFGRFMKKEVLGFGDVKFFAVVGLWLSISQMPPFLFIAGGAGTVMGLGYKYLLKEPIFPFGPALILSFYINLLLSFP